jgi:ABC-type multidrug transport system fused ATPase/permease subunit
MDVADRKSDGSAKDIDYTQLIKEFIAENKMLYVVYIAVLLVFPAESLVFPHVFSHAMAKVQSSRAPSMRDLSRVAALWIGVQALYLVMHAIDLTLVPKFDAFARGRVMKDIVTGFEEHFTEPSTGSLMSSVLKLPEAARDLFYEMHHAVFADLVLLVCTLGYYFWINRALGVVFLVGMIVWSVVTYCFHRSCSVKTYAKERSHDDMHEQIEEVVSNLVTVFVYDTGAQELRKLKSDSRDYASLLSKSLNCAFNFRVMYAVLVVCMFLAIMATSVALVRSGDIKQASFVAVFIVTFTLMTKLMGTYASIKAMQHSIGIVRSTSASVKDTLKSDRDTPPPRPACKEFAISDLVLDGITYETADGRVILDDVHCKFDAGKTSAVVGKIGSGKSTVTRLLMRLDRPNSGDIKSGGQSIYDLSVESFRRQVAFVPQQPRLMNRTLRENLTYGGAIRDADKVPGIFRSIGMDDIAKVFEERMDENVGKGGHKLSGGQRQAAWLVRALLSDARVVIMDEPSSALDHASRDQVVRFINTAMKGRTLIYVSHDHALISQADDVFEMREGKLIKRDDKRL